MSTTTTSTTRGTRRLLAALLPATWPARAALLDAAARFDHRCAGHPIDALLLAWSRWRGTGELPADALLRELVAGIATVLGGVGPELRLRPRESA